ncbi:unnamed protein product [Penicillium olsonii]|uniref:RNA polymerase II transcription factor B subunit 5 n=1 Tax=Penicillium olsonii TaxID=99116 RepID=A0A9W4HBH4_PENOL|nr:unnamed protein product [Penicillium olsonii]CAG7977512.1 unnamed protein product [Penicillium olsonii]
MHQKRGYTVWKCQLVSADRVLSGSAGLGGAPGTISPQLSASHSNDLLQPFNMPRAVRGLLIECDPSIKSMILKYDEERHDYIVEDLDDENHLVIKESQLENLKYRLDRVFHLLRAALAITNLVARTLTRRSCSSMSPSLNKLEIELSARRDIPYKHRAHRRTNELPEPTYKPTYQTTRFPRHNGHDLICDLLRTLAVWVSIDTVPISIFWHPANVHVLSVCIQDFGRSSTTTSIENI